MFMNVKFPLLSVGCVWKIVPPGLVIRLSVMVGMVTLLQTLFRKIWPLTFEPALLTATLYELVWLEPILSVTFTLVRFTVVMAVGVPVIVSEVPPVLVAVRPSPRENPAPVTVVPLIDHV